MNGILLQANEKFITPLLNFRKQIGSVKQTKKGFDKATSKLCSAQDKYVAMSGKKEESLAEAAETVGFSTLLSNCTDLTNLYCRCDWSSGVSTAPAWSTWGYSTPCRRGRSLSSWRQY